MTVKFGTSQLTDFVYPDIMIVSFTFTIAFIIYGFLSSIYTCNLESIHSYQLVAGFKSILFFKLIELKLVTSSLTLRSVKSSLVNPVNLEVKLLQILLLLQRKQ